MSDLFSLFKASISKCLNSIARRWRASPTKTYWRIWLSELRECIPARARHWLISETPIQVWHWPLSEPLSVRLDEARHWLLLPSSAVLIQHLQLPVTAARNITSVVSYELDKFTPFPRDQLYYVVLNGKAEKKLFQITLVAISRERLAKILAECAELGIGLDAIDVINKTGTPMGIDLLPSHLRVMRSHIGRGSKGKLTFFCVGLLLSLMAFWVHGRQQLLEHMSATVQGQKAEVAKVQQLQQQLNDARGVTHYLAKLKAVRPAMAVLLSELTSCIPQNTWIDQLEINDKSGGVFNGRSAKVSTLITRIKNCHSFENAHFEGVIQRDAKTDEDQFSLRAQLRSEAFDETTAETP